MTMHERTIAPSEADRMYFDAITEQFRIRELIKSIEGQKGKSAQLYNLNKDLEHSIDWCKKLDTRRFEDDEN